MNVIDELDSYINNSNIYKNDTKFIPFWNKKCSKLSKKLWKPSENLEERDSDGVNIKPLNLGLIRLLNSQKMKLKFQFSIKRK